MAGRLCLQGESCSCPWWDAAKAHLRQPSQIGFRCGQAQALSSPGVGAVEIAALIGRATERISFRAGRTTRPGWSARLGQPRLALLLRDISHLRR